MTYIDGFVAPVFPGRGDDYARMARESAAIFLEHGALQVVETVGDDVHEGKVTDLWRAVQADKAAGETVVFSWILWPSKEARDAGWAKAMADERMTPPADSSFDMKRMIYGGFNVILDTGAPK